MKKYFLTFIFVVLALFGLYSYFVMGNQLRAWRGVSKSEDFVKNVYGDHSVLGQNCQGEDTNADGYITCNLRLLKNGDDKEKTITLQCPTFWKSFMGTSCKEQGMLINQN